MDELDVHVLGFESTPEQAVRGLMQLFGLSAEAARSFVASAPCVAKAGASADEAKHYVAALKRIGARVECRRKSERGTHPEEELARLSREVERQTETAIARWRIAEGRDVDSQTRARNLPPNPRVPADLMAHRESVGWTDPPQEEGTATWLSRNPLDHVVSHAPDPLDLSSSTPPLESDGVGSSQGPDSHPAGSRHAVGVTRRDDDADGGRPGSLLATRTRSGRRDNPAARTLALLLGLGAFGGLLFLLLTANPDEAAERLKAWQRQGIDGGDHEPAAAFVASGGQLRSMEPAAASELVRRFLRGGAVNVWATRIRSQGEARTSDQLVIELPTVPQERRTLLWQGGRALGHDEPIPDEGQAYLAIPVTPR